ncbi:ABC-2 family transporter protein [Nocardiopsis sp. NPDC007018]|uniref:ABC transporter permease n=1 Tax=Nocardiopsis sp. NPDC007018 TaxID=3155721 RepID=UPI0033F38F13
MLTIQICLFCWLWTALYSPDSPAGPAEARIMVTYATLALLLSRIRWFDRITTHESLPMRVREGTIAYWFVRPVSPHRYYFLRSVGEALFGSCLALFGVLVAALFGAVHGPPNLFTGLVSLLSVVLGQFILYYLAMVIDLMCFWLIANDSVKYIYSFTQDLFSGVFIPLWLFPGWLAFLAELLPFKATIYQPLAIYLGRIPLSQAPGVLLWQCAWCVFLAVLVRVLWYLAGRRVVVQGG